MSVLDPLTGFDVDLWCSLMEKCKPYTYQELSKLSWKQLKGLANQYQILPLNTEDTINKLLEKKAIKYYD